MLLNKNQKKFNREMNKIKKEKAKQGKELVYSYIKGDFIDYYTSSQRKIEKKKIKKKGPIGATIITLLLVSYAIYSWSDFALFHTLGIKLPRPELPHSTLAMNPLHRDIVNYLKFIESQDSQMGQLLNYSTAFYGQAWKDPDQRKLYLSTMKQNQTQINQILADTIQSKFPKQMEPYYQIVIQRYQNISNACIHAFNAVLNLDRQSDSQFRVLLNNIGIQNQQQQVELTKVFDKAGIKWKQTPNGLQYTIRSGL